VRLQFVVRAAALALALPLVGCGTGTAESPTAARETDRLTVESVEVRILESFPVQVSAQVKGYLRDGCESLAGTTQSRSGNTITVTIETARAMGRACVQVLAPVEENVRLDGSFPAGTYLVRVNGTEQTFRID
jgi:inhibitor of cysteine peptidase